MNYKNYKFLISTLIVIDLIIIFCVVFLFLIALLMNTTRDFNSRFDKNNIPSEYLIFTKESSLLQDIFQQLAYTLNKNQSNLLVYCKLRNKDKSDILYCFIYSKFLRFARKKFFLNPKNVDENQLSIPHYLSIYLKDWITYDTDLLKLTDQNKNTVAYFLAINKKNWLPKSYDVLRTKEFKKKNFKIIGAKEGSGTQKGAVIWNLECLNNSNKSFFAIPIGTINERIKIYKRYQKNPENYIGKYVPVKYLEITNEGCVSRNPIVEIL
jgi:hypothetical protein